MAGCVYITSRAYGCGMVTQDGSSLTQPEGTGAVDCCHIMSVS